MKKLLSILVVMLCAITTYAQAPFTTYKPLQPSNNYSNDYSGSYQSTDPFTYYRPLQEPGSSYTQSPRPKSKTYNLTGYYKEGSDWYTTPIKVTVNGDRAILSSYKKGSYWMDNTGVVSEVDYYDSDVVKENFNYKARTVYLGVVYF